MKNKTVLITGASRGIGREIALAFARAGYDVAACYFKEKEKAGELKSEIERSRGKCEIFECDVSDRSSIKRTALAVRAVFGRIDVLVNNAAICRDRIAINMSDEEWDSVIRTDLTGPMSIMQEYVPLIDKSGGAIINISSIAGVRGNFGGANYAAAKAGLIALTKTAAKEFGPKHITVNAVLPGFHLTDMGKALTEKYTNKIKEESALGLTTDVKELAGFVVFLSNMKTVSGQIFNIDSRII